MLVVHNSQSSILRALCITIIAKINRHERAVLACRTYPVKGSTKAEKLVGLLISNANMSVIVEA